jgi:hypothetical protein
MSKPERTQVMLKRLVVPLALVSVLTGILWAAADPIDPVATPAKDQIGSPGDQGANPDSQMLIAQRGKRLRRSQDSDSSAPTTTNATTFPASKVKQVREQAQKAIDLGQPTHKGWAKSGADPMKLLPAFAPLRIKEGFVLRAYQFCEGGNGNGIVWAMPANAEFPDPEKCPKVKDRFHEAPKPPAALDDVMEVVQGDDSPWSYLAASLLQRELKEFGAMWHGTNWNTHRVLGENPLKADSGEGRVIVDRPSGKPEEWKWVEREPRQWNPQVRTEKDSVTVTFYTYSGHQKQTIYRHTDTFKRGSYRFKTERKEIAQGPGGFMF